jgi:hypothetical protein
MDTNFNSSVLINEAVKVISEILTGALENNKIKQFSQVEENKFTVDYGSSQVLITATADDEDKINSIEFSAIVTTGTNLKPELMELLLKSNTSYETGAFGILFDGTIVYKQILLTDKLTPLAISRNLEIVGKVADKYDDIIVNNFGGNRATDVDFEV